MNCTPRSRSSRLLMAPKPFTPVREDKTRPTRKTNLAGKLLSLDPEEVKRIDRRDLRRLIVQDLSSRFGFTPKSILGDLKASGDAAKDLGLKFVKDGRAFIIENDEHNRLICLKWLGSRHLQGDLFDTSQSTSHVVKHRKRPEEQPIRARKFTVLADGLEWPITMEIWRCNKDRPNILDTVIKCPEFRIEVSIDLRTGTLITPLDSPTMRLVALESVRWWRNTLVSDTGPTGERITKAKADYLSKHENDPHVRHPHIKGKYAGNEKPFLVHACIVNGDMLSDAEYARRSEYVGVVNKEIDEWVSLNGIDRGKFNDWLVSIGLRDPDRNYPGAD